MNSFQQMPTLTSLFSTYASLSTLLILLRSILHDFIPPPLRNYILTLFHHLFKRRTNRLTLIIEEFHGSGMTRNEVYTSAEIYLCTIITTPVTDRLKVSKSSKDKSLTIRFEKGEEIHDVFESIPLRWRFVSQEAEKRRSASRGGDEDDRYSSLSPETRLFELSFEKQYKDKVINNYIPHVISSAKALKAKERNLKLCTLGNKYSYGNVYWDSTNLEHPSTFDTLAIDPEVKASIKDDLDRFVTRREFYKRVGRAWKRGYLLYGPPGTGKSSLIAAMANYLMFDIYDLQLGNLIKDSDLRRLLLATANRSILVIEDIDCTIDIKNRSNTCTENGQKGSENQSQLTLSGLLNFIDGIWSCCGDERIIIFTTNNKDSIDPALLRPGRMDMHIHMSYLTFSSFKILASNYLNIRSEHPLFDEIKTLIEAVNVTPAQVAEELMRSEDVGVALQGVVKLLRTQKVVDNKHNIVESESGVSQNVVNLNLLERAC